jgi:hypothetical protein
VSDIPEFIEKPSDPFENLDGKDGYHVFLLNNNLYGVVYSGGQQVNLWGDDPEAASAVIAGVNPVPTEYAVKGAVSVPDAGALVRLKYVIEAVARYLTTGGTYAQLQNAMEAFKPLARGGLAFPGWHLVDSFITDELTFQHIFAKDDGSGAAVLWEEPTFNESGGAVGGFIDRTTLDALHRQDLDDGGEEETEGGEED